MSRVALLTQPPKPERPARPTRPATAEDAGGA
jgi:hypothetical protein